MGLVDYDSSSDSADDPPPAKRRKPSTAETAPAGGADTADTAATTPDMPPLPVAFHDLYASTVRQSVVDDPSLHQGRRRQTPHLPGIWPTHLYVEWHPTTEQHSMLVELLDTITQKLGHECELHNFLTSDLGSPLPLHISLSRPLSLSTSQKDEFLEKVTHATRNSHIAAFNVRPNDLRWFKSPDSDRTFLILQVTSGTDNDDEQRPINPELINLLTRCNAIAASFEQPVLYQQNQTGRTGSWFHVSIGWTFDTPTNDVSAYTKSLLRQSRFRAILDWKVEVSSLKAKIGNVIAHIPLSKSGRGTSLGGVGRFLR